MKCFCTDQVFHSRSIILIHPVAYYLFVLEYLPETQRFTFPNSNIFLIQNGTSSFVSILNDAPPSEQKLRSQFLNFISLTLCIKCFLFSDIALPSRISLEFYHFPLSVSSYFPNFPLRISQLSHLASNFSMLSHFPLYQG